MRKQEYVGCKKKGLQAKAGAEWELLCSPALKWGVMGRFTPIPVIFLLYLPV